MDGHVQHRAQEVLGDAAESFGQCAEDPVPPGPVGPEFRGGVGHGSIGRAATSAVERVGVLHLGPRPAQPVFREVVLPAEGCVHGQRVEAAAFVVEQARQGQFAAARTATDRLCCLEHSYPYALGGEDDGGSEPVGPAADYHRVGHAPTLTRSGRTCGWR